MIIVEREPRFCPFRNASLYNLVRHSECCTDENNAYPVWCPLLTHHTIAVRITAKKENIQGELQPDENKKEENNN